MSKDSRCDDGWLRHLHGAWTQECPSTVVSRKSLKDQVTNVTDWINVYYLPSVSHKISASWENWMLCPYFCGSTENETFTVDIHWSRAKCTAIIKNDERGLCEARWVKRVPNLPSQTELLSGSASGQNEVCTFYQSSLCRRPVWPFPAIWRCSLFITSGSLKCRTVWDKATTLCVKWRSFSIPPFKRIWVGRASL